MAVPVTNFSPDGAKLAAYKVDNAGVAAAPQTHYLKPQDEVVICDRAAYTALAAARSDTGCSTVLIPSLEEPVMITPDVVGQITRCVPC